MFYFVQNTAVGCEKVTACKAPLDTLGVAMQVAKANLVSGMIKSGAEYDGVPYAIAICGKEQLIARVDKEDTILGLAAWFLSRCCGKLTFGYVQPNGKIVHRGEIDEEGRGLAKPPEFKPLFSPKRPLSDG